jgi:hypothetical protein
MSQLCHGRTNICGEHTSSLRIHRVGINRHVKRAVVLSNSGRGRGGGDSEESKRETHFGSWQGFLSEEEMRENATGSRALLIESWRKTG